MPFRYRTTVLAREPGLTRLSTAIFLLSGAALLFQFAQTRLFSAALDYHLTFLVISGALLGVGAAGTASAVADGSRWRPGSARLASAAGASVVVALLIETRVDPVVHTQPAAVVVGYALGALPVFFASWVIVRALRDHPAASGTLYAADLAGAALGGLIGYLGVGSLGAHGVYGLAAALALFAAGALAPTRVAAFAAAGALALAPLLSVVGETVAPPRPTAEKAATVWIADGAVRELVRWDATARVDALRQGATTYYRFLIDQRSNAPRPPTVILTLDLDASTPILRAEGGADLSVLDDSILAAPYAVLERPAVLVVGPGGGIDVIVALRQGASLVVGVEVNRTVVELMRSHYAAYSGRLYQDPAVRIVEDEARSFVRRSLERYDAIVLTIVDSWAALATGAYALTESYLYTEEAFADYVRHLSPGGILSVGRWYRDPPTEMLRTAEVAWWGLHRVGVERPEERMLVLRHGPFGMLLVRAGPFTQAEVDRIGRFASAHGFAVAYDPLRPGGPFAVALAEAGRRGPPATDDRPFFFDSLPLTPELIADAFAFRAAVPRGYLTVYVALVAAGILSYAVVLLPVRRHLGKTLRAAPYRVAAAYGVLLGFGFISTEIAVLQRLTLYLGQPSLAFTVGLAALLGGAAVGARLSGMWPGGLRTVTGLSALLLLATLLSFPAVADATLSWSLLERLLVASAATAAVGVPMGAAFPRVVAGVGGREGAVPWLWAVNGSASVVGSITAVAIALAVGFSGLAAFAVLCYAMAALLEGERALGPAGGARIGLAG